MSRHTFFRNALLTCSVGAILLLGSVMAASAQDANREYRDWQRAQIEAQQRYQDYLRSRSGRDYQEWQRAQARAQREYADYQQTMNRSNRYYNNNGYNNGNYNNNGYYTSNGYSNNSGRYRVYSNGSYYEVDSRGAELLRQAVRNGYSQGYREGQRDRRYGRGLNYGVNNVYNNGLYGWNSYVARNQYQYYFQQGFQRGYEDGYNNTLQYGMRSGNGFNILSSVLNTIFNIADNR